MTIPITVRERLGIREGDYLTLEVSGNKILLLPSRTVSNPTEVLSGHVRGISLKEPIDDELSKAAALRLQRKLKRFST